MATTNTTKTPAVKKAPHANALAHTIRSRVIGFVQPADTSRAPTAEQLKALHEQLISSAKLVKAMQPAEE